MKVIVVTIPELGWDCVVCVASSMDAAAKYLEFDSVEDMKKDKQYVFSKRNIEKKE